MCFRRLVLLLFVAVSCAQQSRIRMIESGEITMGFFLSEDEPLEDPEDQTDVVDSIRNTLLDEPILMNAIQDSQTGEMVAVDELPAATVTARFRHVAERGGRVTISFDISVPSAMCDSKWQLKISPDMYMQDDTLHLEPVFITGSAYRASQLRGYERYDAFLSGIITDSTDLVWLRQLEIFLERNAEEIFGISQKQALEHYKRHLRIRMNDKRGARSDEMFHKFVKDPIVTDGVKLDTVFAGDSGDFIYRYTHEFRTRPRLKKVIVALSGSLYERGERFMELPFHDDLTFYISSLSSLVDERPRYVIDSRHDPMQLDSVYMAGIAALKELDYKTAIRILRPYNDYNTALALITGDSNHTALDVLGGLDDTDAKVCYLKAMVLSRLGQIDEAMKYFILAIAYDPSLEHRAGLDPEMYHVVDKYRSCYSDSRW